MANTRIQLWGGKSEKRTSGHCPEVLFSDGYSVRTPAGKGSAHGRQYTSVNLGPVSVLQSSCLNLNRGSGCKGAAAQTGYGEGGAVSGPGNNCASVIGGAVSGHLDVGSSVADHNRTVEGHGDGRAACCMAARGSSQLRNAAHRHSASSAQVNVLVSGEGDPLGQVACVQGDLLVQGGDLHCVGRKIDRSSAEGPGHTQCRSPGCW